jgi:hypothetical protein
MSANINPHPEEVRIAVRYQNFPNQEIEREIIQQTDRAVFERVHDYEQMLVGQIQTLRQEADVDLTAGNETISALQSEVRWALEVPTGELQNDLPAIAARYKTLRATAEKVIAALEKADRDEQALAARCADPHKSLNELWTRWPILRPVI